MLLSRGEDFAAASPILVASDVTNVGDAVLNIVPKFSPTVLWTELRSADFHNGLSAISCYRVLLMEVLLP